MKKIAVTLFILGMGGFAFGQGAVMTKYFEKFADNEDYTKVSVSSKMFSLFTDLEGGTDEEKEFLEAVGKLKGMKAVVGEEVENAEELYKNAIADITRNGYEELMTVTDAEENVMISIKEKGSIIEELMLAAGGNDKFVLVSLYGEIDLKKISSLARSMQIEGMRHLGNISDEEDEDDDDGN